MTETAYEPVYFLRDVPLGAYGATVLNHRVSGQSFFLALPDVQAVGPVWRYASTERKDLLRREKDFLEEKPV
jgi:hypothetical protein